MTEPCLFRGEGDESRLVVSFTGWTDDAQKEKFAFRDLCRRLGYRHILLRDPLRLAYFGGIPGAFPSYGSLLAGLGDEVRRVGAKNAIFIGESLGGFAALLLGHELGVGSVHAFAPFTCFNVLEFLGKGSLNDLKMYRRELLHLHTRAFRHRRLFCLRHVLSSDNGVTRSFVHASAGRNIDRLQALHLQGRPRVDVVLHDDGEHLIALHLVRQRTLEAWVRSTPEELDLSRSRIDDAALAALSSLRNVRSLRLTGTRASKDAIESLRKVAPHLDIRT